MSDAVSQRLDKWLWHARFARTRSASQDLVRAGRVRINRDKTREPDRQVRVGDVLTIALRDGVRVITVVGMADRRGSFPEAQKLYEEKPPQERSNAPPGESLE